MAILKKIRLRNFRNFTTLDTEFAPGLNILLGQNGQGKTNLLESIYFLSVLRSFRTNTIKDLKKWKNSNGPIDPFADLFYIGGEITQDHTPPTHLSISYGEKRQLKINQHPIHKSSDFLGKLICIAFAPDDIDLICGQGKGRRRFIDITLSQLHPQYLNALQRYTQALKRRNSILKMPPTDTNKRYLRSFDDIFCQNAALLHYYRIHFYRKMRKIIKEKSKQFYGTDQTLSIDITSNTAPLSHFNNLDDSIPLIAKEVQQKLTQSLEKDYDRRMTTIGPHRDDFATTLNKKRLKAYGSRGQCRLASLLLRIASSELFLTDHQPHRIVFLVDDVTGELDHRIEKAFFELLDRGAQTFFATTHIPEIIKEKPHTLYHINNGQLQIIPK